MVDSCPPCCVALDEKTEPTLPTCTACPERAGLVDEVLHLRRHVSVACACAKDDGVILGQFLYGSDQSTLVELVAGVFRHIRRDQLRHSLDNHVGAGFASPFCHGVRHGFDVSVG